MDKAVPLSKKEHYFTLSVLSSLALLVIASALFPRFLGYGPAAIGLISFLSYRHLFGRAPENWLKHVITAGTLWLLVMISLLWTGQIENPNHEPHTSFALERGIKLFFILYPGALLSSVCLNLPAQNVRTLWPKIIMGSALITALICLIELYARAPFWHLTHGVFDQYPLQTHDLSYLNRSVLILILCVPTALILSIQHSKKIAAILALFAALIVIKTDSQSAQLAALCAALIYVIFPVERPKAWVGLKFLIIALIIGAPFLAQALFTHIAPLVTEYSWFARGYAGNRLEIWDFVARYALQNPITGYGVEAARIVPEFESQELYHTSKTVLHPHNFALQIWIEFGAIGAAVISGVLIWIMTCIRRFQSQDAKRLCLTILIAALAAASTGYGLWQGWWVGAFTFLIALCLCTSHLFEDSSPSKGQ